MNNPMIETSNLNKTYVDGKLEVNVLNGVNLTVKQGEQLAIVGASGSGKSTLLHLIGALDNPTKGNVTVDGVDVYQLSAKQQGDFRNKNVGFVYQFHHLLAEFTALENVAMPLIIRGLPEDEANSKAQAMIEKVSMSHRMEHKPAELSGGERQRIAIARALVSEPKLVLADEPTGNLDHATALQVYELMCELNRDMGTTFITVTHDLELANKMQRRLKLVDGVLSED